MIVVVPSIVEMLMNKTALRVSVRAGDWTANRAMIVSNVPASKISDTPNCIYPVIVHSVLNTVAKYISLSQIRFLKIS